MTNRSFPDGTKEAIHRIAIAKAKRLPMLDLENLGLTTLPKGVGSLTWLSAINLGKNKLSTLPSEIRSLNRLLSLFLHYNQFTTLPQEIESLAKLMTLVINNNKIERLPTYIGNLDNIRNIDLSSNRLTSLPREILKLELLTKLSLEGNLNLGIPSELLISSMKLIATPYDYDVQYSISSRMPGSVNIHDTIEFSDTAAGKVFSSPRAHEILAYYFASLDGKALREIKLILVGRGEVGKTSLADALQGKPFKKNRARTDGILITPWQVKPKGGDAAIRIWDFGGQEIMHGTHQFFLSRRAIYVVMVDGRDDRYQREAEYWLKLVRAFGGDSTVIVVMNRQHNYKFDLDRNALATKYNVPVDHFFATECSQKGTINPLRKFILRLTTQILSTQANFPAKWWKIKAELEVMKQDYLSNQEYRDLCKKYSIDDDSEQEQLLDRLNDLGTVLHFDAENSLAELKVLNPEWATDGVYRVMTDEKLREEKHGKLKASSLKEILPGDRWPSTTHRCYILDLMQRFDLCFPAESEPNVYIVPELLPKATPDLFGWSARSGVVFRYEYPILPHGIMPRFISKTHTLSQGQYRWPLGVVVAKDGAEALVRADYDDATIDIWVRGTHSDARRALLAIIRNKFDEIHARFTDLQPIEKVGVPNEPTVFEPYYDMILDERDGVKTVRITIAGQRVDVPLTEILSGVESEAERTKSTERVERNHWQIVINNPLFGDIMRDDHSIGKNSVNTNTQYGRTLTKCTNAIHQQTPGERKDALERLDREVGELVEALPEGDQKEQAVKNYEHLVKEATAAKPDRKWYSLSSEGLLQAAQWVKDFSGNIAGTLLNLGQQLWGPDYKLPQVPTKSGS